MSTFPASGAMSTAIDQPRADLAGPLEVIWYVHTVKRSWPVRRPLFDRVGGMVRSWAFYPGTGSGSGSPPGQAGGSPAPPYDAAPAGRFPAAPLVRVHRPCGRHAAPQQISL